MSQSANLIRHAGELLSRLGARLGRPALPSAQALCWQRDGAHGRLVAIPRPGAIRIEDLQCIERQKGEALRNTRQFIEGLPANNLLLWGPRGTGKSSLIRGLFNHFRAQGLALVELPRELLQDLPELCGRLAASPRRFIIYCDDLSFDANEADFRRLKTALDGSLSSLPDNVLLYATSNRRHLVPETMQENRASRMVDGELHLHESIEEKLALAERFGMRLAFHPFDQDQYLEIVRHWLRQLGVRDADSEAARRAALQWALEHGSRSGRIAWQFARDWTGRQALEST